MAVSDRELGPVRHTVGTQGRQAAGAVAFVTTGHICWVLTSFVLCYLVTAILMKRIPFMPILELRKSRLWKIKELARGPPAGNPEGTATTAPPPQYLCDEPTCDHV